MGKMCSIKAERNGEREEGEGIRLLSQVIIKPYDLCMENALLG